MGLTSGIEGVLFRQKRGLVFVAEQGEDRGDGPDEAAQDAQDARDNPASAQREAVFDVGVVEVVGLEEARNFDKEEDGGDDREDDRDAVADCKDLVGDFDLEQGEQGRADEGQKDQDQQDEGDDGRPSGLDFIGGFAEGSHNAAPGGAEGEA